MKMHPTSAQAVHSIPATCRRASYGFARTQPDLLRPDLRWMSFGEYFILRLFGETAVSYSAASWTGLLNQPSTHLG